MTMSTQTITESARLLGTVLIDQIQISNLGEPVTEGIHVTRTLTSVGLPCAGLVQILKPRYALEGEVNRLYAVKVARLTALAPGQAVTVITCVNEPDLVGKTLMIDSVSLNGLSMIRRGVSSDFISVDEQGKATI